MSTSKVIIAVYDSTTARSLKPLGERLSEQADVEYLLLDELLPRSSMDSEISVENFHPYKRASNYVNSNILQKVNEIERSYPVAEIMIQRLIEDNITPEITYDINGYLEEVSPDVFVCGHDLLPFIKHIIKSSQTSHFKSVVVQHGINRPDLENPSTLPGAPNLLSPETDPNYRFLEKIKRRIGFNHGAFLFCNPYVDEVYTLGDFFTNLLVDLRDSYPCFGKTNVVTAGSTEYNPTGIQQYDPEISDAVFLSQWQYEHNIWNSKQQSYIVQKLKKVESQANISITIRPHPKDSDEKMKNFFPDFDISHEENLLKDVNNHDAVLTVDSTALYTGVIAGKVCGVLQTPWNEITLRPFSHEHIVQITPSRYDLRSSGRKRSNETQRSYLKECCFIPSLYSDNDYNSPVELVANRVKSLCEDKLA
jgi:hypothetical protein